MSDTLDYLNTEAIARELIRKTRGCAFLWQQQSVDSFLCNSFDSEAAVPVLWEFILSKVNGQYTIDISRNTVPYTTVISDALEELFELVFSINNRSNVKKQTVLQFIQNKPDCINNNISLVLRPNVDFTAAGSGWLRVPANGYRYEKVRELVAVHDSDSTFIYDNTGSGQIEMGFTPMPIIPGPPDEVPDSYEQIDVQIVVRNISGSPTIEGELSIQVPGESIISQSFTTGGLDSSYTTITWSWTDTFTIQQLNHLRIKFTGVPGVNRVTAIEAQIS